MKKQFFILTHEERLAKALQANFDAGAIETTVVSDWETGSDQLFSGNFDVLFLDIETLRGQPIDTFISIDSMCTNEGVLAVLVVRKLNTSILGLQQKLVGMQTVIETKKGRSDFNQGVRKVVSSALASKVANQDVSLDSVVQLEVDLPLPAKGAVNDHGLFDVLFAINTRNATGYLSVSHGPRSTKFAFRRGDFVIEETTGGTAELRDVVSWSAGTFEFEKKPSIVGRRKKLAPILAIAAKEDIPRRSAMDAMMQSMSKYPCPTSLLEAGSALYSSKFPEAIALARQIDGKKRWSDLIDDGPYSFHSAYFLIHTFLVHTMDTPSETVNVVWSRDVREARDREQQSKVVESKAYRAVASQDEVERELRNLMRDFKEGNAYTIYQLWEGCGRKAVQDRFYEMVKEYHPDVYGGNTSGQLRVMAQNIFIAVKDAYYELRELEPGEQTSPMPEGFKRPETSKVHALEEQSDPLIEEFELDVEMDETRNRFVTRPKTKSKVDVKAKMEKLSAVRKKRARRVSFGGKKTTPSAQHLAPEISTAQLLADVVSETMIETDEERKERLRDEKLEALRKRAQEKTPGALTPAQDNFRDGFAAYREEEFATAYEYFRKAYDAEPARANHVAFYAYMMFKNEPDRAREAEEMMRDAIELNDRQTQPDALLFLAHMLKARGEAAAVKFYERAFALNPNSREAERELRLAKIRGGTNQSEPGTFIKNLFKK